MSDLTLSDGLSVVGLVLTVVGFVITFVQLTRTRRASVATNSAVQLATTRMHSNFLLITLPQFKALELDLDEASDRNDKRLARRTLVAYSHNANRVATLLDGSTDDAEKMLSEALRTSATAASSAKSSLVTGDSANVLEAVKNLLTDIGDLATRAEGIAAKYQIKVK